MLPPCTVPTSLRVRVPSSSTPAFSHFWMSRTTRRSATRCSTNFPSHPWSRVSKNPRISASSTQFTLFVVIPTVSAIIGVCPGTSRCGLRPPRPQTNVGSPGSRSRCLGTCTGSLTARGPATPRLGGAPGMAFRLPPQRRHPEVVHAFRGSIPGPHLPLSTLRGRPHGRPRMTRGRRGSLRLRRMTLSFTAPRRCDRRTEAAMISEADAVVIGAGALGLSTAFHLTRFGLRRVALVDRFAPGSQTSARAAGLFKLVQADETRTRLARLSVQKVTRFMEETGVPLEVVRSGSLLVSRTPEHAVLVREEARQSQAWGVDLQLVDGDEAHRLMPLLEGQGIRAACHTPDDVYIDEPSSLLQAYLEACRRQGVTLIPETPVTGIRVKAGQVEGVATSAGEISARIVVDAAGAWARAVAELAGVRAPIVPVRHQLYITEPIAGSRPDHPIVR